ncbi:hypothetical protein LR48_Vigan05g081100 [Vigna angularis]|uniref:Uncharacterized protein n=1 Tax=Phaseolus angularis TaxID=3914 RepID=A0A0L9UKV9_PHAAN|nr:hypothetical protein LR48_Vigan05g081100 [Vigna angularis]
MHDVVIVILRLSRMCMSNVNELICEFSERSEEGERWNQKRHQKVQKEKPKLPLSGSLPLSGTQEFTGDPLRGKMVAEGKKPTHALTVERHFTVERRSKYSLFHPFEGRSSMLRIPLHLSKVLSFILPLLFI